MNDVAFFDSIGRKLVDGNHGRLVEMGGAVQMGGQVFQPAFDGSGIGLLGFA